MKKRLGVFLLILFLCYPTFAKIDQYKTQLELALWNLQKIDAEYINNKLAEAEELLKSGEWDKRREGEDILEEIGPLFVDTRVVETRCMWIDYVTFGNFYRKEDISILLDQIAELDIHILFPEVYAYGTTIYPSKIAKLQDQYVYLWEDGDILEVFIDEAHKRGMEVHPLVRVFSSGYKNPGYLIQQHPEWLEVTRDGTRGDSKSWFVSPVIPEFRRYLEEVMVELVENYDIDGLHLDYMRYEDGDFGYSEASRDLFRKMHFIDPLDIKKGSIEEIKFADFRRAHVDAFVRFCYEELKSIRPDLLISAAVGSPYSWDYNGLFQDWVYWSKEGYIDFVTPMQYRDTTPKFRSAVQEDIRANEANVPLFSGLGLYLFDANELESQIVEVRRNNLPGVAIFSEANMSMIKYLKMKNGAFRQKALPVHRDPQKAIDVYLLDLEERIRDNGQYLGIENEVLEKWISEIKENRGSIKVKNNGYSKMARAINERLEYVEAIRKYYQLPY